ncbi:TPA: VanZ family protein [Streptococcus suis]
MGLYVTWRCCRRKHYQEIPFVWYLLILLFLTVTGRISSKEVRILIIPIWKFGLEELVNVVIFVPLGFLWNCMCCKKYSLTRSVSVGICISCGIEILQLIFHKGTFETMDIITNTCGTIIGYLIFNCFLIVKKKRCERFS